MKKNFFARIYNENVSISFNIFFRPDYEGRMNMTGSCKHGVPRRVEAPGPHRTPRRGWAPTERPVGDGPPMRHPVVDGAPIGYPVMNGAPIGHNVLVKPPSGIPL